MSSLNGIVSRTVATTLAAGFTVVFGAVSVYGQSVSWTGTYIGTHVGTEMGSVETSFAPLPTADTFKALKPITLSTDTEGLVFGGQGGYNFHTGHFVVGGEAEFAISRVKGSTIVTPIVRNDGSILPGGKGTLSAGQKTNWVLNAHPRVGLQAGNAFIFGLVGVTLVQVEDTALTDFRPDFTNHYPGLVDATKHGWHWGAGVEVGASKKVSVFGEFLSYRFSLANEAESGTFDADPPDILGFQVAYTWTTKPTTVLRGGVNFRF